MKKNVSKAMDQMALILAGPTGKTDRTLAKQEKNRVFHAARKEDRQLYARITHDEMIDKVIEDLPDLDEDE